MVVTNYLRAYTDIYVHMNDFYRISKQLNADLCDTDKATFLPYIASCLQNILICVGNSDAYLSMHVCMLARLLIA